MNSKNFKPQEKWYTKIWFLIILAIGATLQPVILIPLIACIFIKQKRFSAHCTTMEAISAEALNIKDEEIQRKKNDIEKEKESIIHQANRDAQKIIQAGRDELSEIKRKIHNKQETMDEIIREATEKSNELLASQKYEIARIESEIGKKDFYIRQVEYIKEDIAELEKKRLNHEEKIDRLMSIQKSVNKAIKTYFKGVETADAVPIILPENLITEINELVPTITLKLHSMDYKELNRAFRANNKIIDETVARYEKRYTTKTNRAIYELMVIALRAELQNVLYTLTYSKLNDAIGTVKEIINKYLNIARDGSQTISSTLAKFIGEIEPLFIDAVKIEYEYFAKREAARQEQQELRAQMREEAEEQKRLQEQQEQMEKEASKYTSEITNIQEQLKDADEQKQQQLLDKIRELEAQLHDLEEKKEDIVRLQNGKAGYVYVISNLGSFGDDVFKVGMTRRLNPQERVDELGDASVPFKFDVHSFIFSQDAVQLESDLHEALEANRLNKINPRKEFFKISLDELEALVDKFDPSAEFNRTMQAEQYRQSLSITEENLA